MKTFSPASGTTPPGVSGETQGSQWVERMFARIAPRYDLLNHLLSFNIDRGWRRALLKAVSPALQSEQAVVLDLCCGTGDVYLDFSAVSKALVLGADFCHPMLTAAKAKAGKQGITGLLAEADGLNLPFGNGSLDCIAIAFGFRNLVNYRAGLAEFLRVLKPGGIVAILEFSHPTRLPVRIAYAFYSRVILPVVGGLISGSTEAYKYLPSSIQKFPGPVQLADLMRSTGFDRVEFQLLTGGIAAIHVAVKARESASLAEGAINLVT